jgi:ATP-dependent helicase/nuclease subunit A
VSAAGGPRPLSDGTARRRAATLFDRNLVVVAGAGTGKTALLVERALNLVAGHDVPMTEIAAITFTEKAAAELRERLARALDELRVLARGRTATAGLAPDTEARRAYAWLAGEAGLEARLIEERALAALVDLDIASVSTLHAFCADILRRHPREAGVDPAFAVDDGPSFQGLFEKAWERFLAEELGPHAPRPAIWRRALLLPGALDGVVSVGSALASFRLPSEAAEGHALRPASPGALFGDEVERLLAAIADVRRRARGMNTNMETFLDLSALYLRSFLETGPASMAAIEGPWTLSEYLGKKPAVGRRLEGCAPEEVEEIAARGRQLVAALACVDEETIAAVAEAAAPLAQRARERLLSAGFVSFDALLRLARDLLARDTNVRGELAARHRVILVDEFQDTDPLQYEILFFLSEEEGAPAEDAYRTRLSPGRLFIVGDPKQSIYRFRGADIEAYRRAVDHVTACGGEILTLDNSFRSPDEIVGPTNTLFEAFIGRHETNEQQPYQPIVSARGPAADGTPRFDIWSVQAAGDVDERRAAEGNVIASWIAANRGRPEATGRPLSCRHVALLFRALTNVDLYAQSMRRAGLPFVVEGGKSFYERPEVGDLIAFLRAAANPNDRAALLAVLRGPLGGVPDAELAGFVSVGGRLDLASAGDVDAAGFPGLFRVLALLETFRDAMRGRAPDEIIRAALRDTPLLILHAALFEGPQRVANLRKLVASAEDLARRGLSLEESLRALEDEFRDEREEGESPLADETVDAVRILSVHKAKGLEFDVVFVPDLGRESQHSRASGTSVAWVPQDAGFLGVRLSDGTMNLAWVKHERATRLHEEAEEKRVFYVACTRARERLVLVNSNEERRAPWRDALAALGYSVEAGFPPDGPLADGRVMHRRLAASAAKVPEPGMALDERWKVAALRFEETAATAAGAAPPLRSPARAAEEEPRGTAPAPGAAAARDTARLAGAAAHVALQRWDFEDAARLRALAREAVERVLEQEIGAAADDDLRRRVGAETDGIVEEFLRSPLPGRLKSAEVLGREVPILFRDETGVTWSGACDLVYRDGGGRLIVADYKTERLGADPTAAARRHRRQVEIYLDAFRRALPHETVRGEILFVRAGVSVEI